MTLFSKTLCLSGVLFLMSAPVVAEEKKSGNYSKDAHIAVSVTDGVTVVTLPGQNTNGEDLKCVIYEAFGNNGGAGGIDCNWTPANLQRRK